MGEYEISCVSEKSEQAKCDMRVLLVGYGYASARV